jgi:hypothetical protein
MMMRWSMMPVQNGDELKIGMFADDAPERQHQVIVITKRPHRGQRKLPRRRLWNALRRRVRRFDDKVLSHPGLG